MLKKLIIILSLSLAFPSQPVEAPVIPPQEYTMVGKYADCGLVFDQYGDIWEYWQADVPDNVNVRITMSDNGTKDIIEDDIVLNIEPDYSLKGDASLYWLTYYQY